MAYKVTRFSVIPTSTGVSTPIKEQYTVPNPEEKEKTFAVDKKSDKKKLFLEDIKKRGTITEKEILLIKRRLNDGTYKTADIEGIYDLKLTQEQNTKGFNWLFDKWKSAKTGTERKNNPYGSREENVLETFKEIKFMDFNDQANYYQSEAGIHNYVPLYRVEGTEGSFEYYVQGGEPSIVG